MTLVVERWARADHPRSNEAFARKAFSAANTIRITGLYNGAESPGDGVASIAGLLGDRQKPFNTVILDMGDDGNVRNFACSAAYVGLLGDLRRCVWRN